MSLLMKIVSMLEEIERNTVDLNTKDKVKDLIDFIETTIYHDGD